MGSPLVFLFDLCYMLLIIGFIFWQVPKKVIRENDRIKLVFCCRTRVVPIDNVIEIRIVRRAKVGRRCCPKRTLCSVYPWKCFWGYPTNFSKGVIIVTNSHCNNYTFCLHEMDAFIAENWPENKSSPQPVAMGAG